ncbi:MAG: hypothetical protein AAF998_19935, partial [Bacteroidota bacterium]
MKMTLCTLMLFAALLLSVCAHGQTPEWKTTGNANLDPNCFIGTTDPTPVKFKVNGNTQMKIKNNGQVKLHSLSGIGRAYVTVAEDGTLLRQTDPGVDSLFDCSTKLWKADGNYLTPNCFIGSTNAAALRIFTHNVERIRVTESGKVGIGTTGPKGMLQIGDYMPLTISVRANGPSDSRYMLGFNTYLDGTTPHYANHGPGAMINWDAVYSDICLGVAPFGTAGQQALIPVTLAVGQNGRVGIGVRQQQALLHLRQAGGAADLRIESGDPLAAPRLEFWAGPFGNSGAANLGTIRTTYNTTNGLSELRFGVNDGQNPTNLVQVLQMDKEEAILRPRLGIGTAPNLQDQLTVAGAGRFTSPNAADNFVRIRHNGSDAVIEHATATTNSNATNRLLINPGGNRTDFGGDVIVDAHLGLGTADFVDGGNGKDYRLSVDGRIRAREVKVYSGWADHVFAPGYELMPLSELALYIAERGHLPGVPSAAEVSANGVDVGETQALLLEKIEELTL